MRVGNNLGMENNSQNIVKSIERIAKSSDAVDDVAPFVSMLFNHIVDKGEREIVIVCFGTNAISGDALGPMVGTLLTQKYDVPAFVYGTDEAQINGKNMQEWLAFIKSVHQNALFVAVDASLGSKDKVGQIVVE